MSFLLYYLCGRPEVEDFDPLITCLVTKSWAEAINDLKTHVQLANSILFDQAVNRIERKYPSDGSEGKRAVALYSADTPMFGSMNAVLREPVTNWGTQAFRGRIVPFASYIPHLLKGLNDNCPPHPSTRPLYRCIVGNPHQIGTNPTLVTGSIYTLSTFTSTCDQPEVAEQNIQNFVGACDVFTTHVYNNIPHGRNITTESLFPNESEVLLVPGIAVQVDGIVERKTQPCRVCHHHGEVKCPNCGTLRNLVEIRITFSFVTSSTRPPSLAPLTLASMVKPTPSPVEYPKLPEYKPIEAPPPPQRTEIGPHASVVGTRNLYEGKTVTLRDSESGVRVTASGMNEEIALRQATQELGQQTQGFYDTKYALEKASHSALAPPDRSALGPHPNVIKTKDVFFREHAAIHGKKVTVSDPESGITASGTGSNKDSALRRATEDLRKQTKPFYDAKHQRLQEAYAKTSPVREHSNPSIVETRDVLTGKEVTIVDAESGIRVTGSGASEDVALRKAQEELDKQSKSFYDNRFEQQKQAHAQDIQRAETQSKTEFDQKLSQHKEHCKKLDQESQSDLEQKTKHAENQFKQDVWRDVEVAALTGGVIGGVVATYQVYTNEKLKQEYKSVEEKAKFVGLATLESACRGGISSGACGITKVAVGCSKGVTRGLPIVGALCNSIYDIGKEFYSKGTITKKTVVKSGKSFVKNSTVGVATGVATGVITAGLAPVLVVPVGIGISLIGSSLLSGIWSSVVPGFEDC